MCKRERFIRIYSDGIKARTLERVETFFLLSGGGSISLRTEDDDDAAATGAAASGAPRGVSNERSSSDGGCKFVGSMVRGVWRSRERVGSAVKEEEASALATQAQRFRATLEGARELQLKHGVRF